MKIKTIELNVDYIGGQSPLTKEEEIALSEYFKRKKIKSDAKENKRRTILSRRKLEKA